MLWNKRMLISSDELSAKVALYQFYAIVWKKKKNEKKWKMKERKKEKEKKKKKKEKKEKKLQSAHKGVN